MPRRPTLKLPPLNLGKETIGERIARLRKALGFTQEELAKSIGIVQTLVSDYERNKIRLHAEMVIRFARPLEVSTDELLGLTKVKSNGTLKNRRLQRRINRMNELSKHDQETVIRMLDSLLKGSNGKR
jgi:transcriptional regulator with XRE-family HTH domain